MNSFYQSDRSNFWLLLRSFRIHITEYKKKFNCLSEKFFFLVYSTNLLSFSQNELKKRERESEREKEKKKFIERKILFLFLFYSR